MVYVKSVTYLQDYKIWVVFDDGTAGEVDLADALDGPVFEPLKDTAYFRQATIDPELDQRLIPNWKPSPGPTAQTWRISSTLS